MSVCVCVCGGGGGGGNCRVAMREIAPPTQCRSLSVCCVVPQSETAPTCLNHLPADTS